MDLEIGPRAHSMTRGWIAGKSTLRLTRPVGRIGQHSAKFLRRNVDA